MTSRALPARMRRFLLTCSLVSTPAWTGCGHLSPPRPTPIAAALQVQIPETISAPCQHPDKTGVRTIGDLASFAIAGEADLKVCDGYRAAAVQMIQVQNAAAAALARALAPPRPWWRVW